MAVSAFSTFALNIIAGLIQNSTALLTDGAGSIKVGLFVNNVQPDSTMAISDLGEATTSGYARLDVMTPEWSLGFNAEDQNELVLSTSATFNFTTPNVSPETVYGFFICDGTSLSDLLYARTLEVPVPITWAGQILSFVPKVALSNDVGGA